MASIRISAVRNSRIKDTTSKFDYEGTNKYNSSI